MNINYNTDNCICPFCTIVCCGFFDCIQLFNQNPTTFPVFLCKT